MVPNYKPQRAYRNKKKQAVQAYKMEKGCMDCGYAEHPEVLEFDHRPDEIKLFALKDFGSHGWNFILAEIKKCDVVCANCHRMRTVNRREEFNFIFEQSTQPTFWGENEP